MFSRRHATYCATRWITRYAVEVNAGVVREDSNPAPRDPGSRFSDHLGHSLLVRLVVRDEHRVRAQRASAPAPSVSSR